MRNEFADDPPPLRPVPRIGPGHLDQAVGDLNDIRTAIMVGAGLSFDSVTAMLRAAVWDAACMASRRHDLPPLAFDQTARNFAALVLVHGEGAMACVASALNRANSR